MLHHASTFDLVDDTPTRIAVIGTGYLGATHAACLAELGFDVLGLDTDAAKVAALNAGHLPFHEEGLPELLRTHTTSGRLRFTTSPAEAARFSAIHFVCVGTPQLEGSLAADTRNVVSAVRDLVPHLTQDTLIISKSTVPVGTTAQLQVLADDLAPGNITVDLVFNPEFLREGKGINDTLHPDRIVVGVHDHRHIDQLRRIYAEAINSGTPFLVTDIATAELVKVAANSFLATKISFINAIAELCDAAGGDVVALAEALGHDQRIGPQFLRAGIGFGGGCLPKDIRALIARAEELGVIESMQFLREVDGINTRRRSQLIEAAIAECDGNIRGKRIAVLGAAFKPATDDVRDSPALDIADQLSQLDADVIVYDPLARRNAERACPTLAYADSVIEAATDADLVLHLTEWDEFAALDPEALNPLVAHRRIIDGRHTLNPERWRAAGWTFRAPGRLASTSRESARGAALPSYA